MSSLVNRHVGEVDCQSSQGESAVILLFRGSPAMAVDKRDVKSWTRETLGVVERRGESHEGRNHYKAP